MVQNNNPGNIAHQYEDLMIGHILDEIREGSQAVTTNYLTPNLNKTIKLPPLDQARLSPKEESRAESRLKHAFAQGKSQNQRSISQIVETSP